MARRPHPFTLDVRRFRHLPGRFTYSDGRVGGMKVPSLHTYETFEEACRAGKAALEAAVAEWERSAPDR
jgi:hypothetical protein